MKRRTALALPALFGACANAQPLRCTHPGLGRGFHLGEVFGRTAHDFADIAATGATLLRYGIALQPDANVQRYEMPGAAMPELLRQQMGQAGRDRLQRLFTREAFIDRFAALYAELTAAPAAVA